MAEVITDIGAFAKGPGTPFDELSNEDTRERKTQEVMTLGAPSGNPTRHVASHTIVSNDNSQGVRGVHNTAFSGARNLEGNRVNKSVESTTSVLGSVGGSITSKQSVASFISVLLSVLGLGIGIMQGSKVRATIGSAMSVVSAMTILSMADTSIGKWLSGMPKGFWKVLDEDEVATNGTSWRLLSIIGFQLPILTTTSLRRNS